MQKIVYHWSIWELDDEDDNSSRLIGDSNVEEATIAEISFNALTGLANTKRIKDKTRRRRLQS